MILRVIKLGGSLLDMPELVPSLKRWLAENPVNKNLIVVGGGKLVDAIRALDSTHHLNAKFVHWQCVDILAHTALVIRQLFPDFDLVCTPEQLGAAVDPSGHDLTAIVKVQSFLSRDRSPSVLPETWAATTDSIAALLARNCCADELVLLKSTSPEQQADSLNAWARAGIVDSCFPSIAAEIPVVRIVNLRSDNGA